MTKVIKMFPYNFFKNFLGLFALKMDGGKEFSELNS